MRSLSNLLAVLTLLTGAVLLAYATATSPLNVSLVLNRQTWHLPFPVVMLALLALVLLAYYLGQLGLWLAQTPQRRQNQRQQAVTQHLATHALAQALGHTHTMPPPLPGPTPALTILTAVHTIGNPSQHTLLTASPSLAQQVPQLHPLIQLTLARQAAENADWSKVCQLTSTLSQPWPPHLLTLHLKALVNTGQPEQASQLLPELKKLLPRPHAQLLADDLSARTQPSTTPNEPIHPWRKSLAGWWPTPSTVWPT